MKILIPIETASREVLYKTYLCHLLALNGFTCYLGSKINIRYLMNRFENYIYFDKGYHKGKSEDLYNLTRSKKGYIVNLDEEGAVDYPDNKTLLTRYSKTLFQASDQVFFWGEKQYNLVKENIVDESKILITGHPRFDLLKQKYHNFYKSEVDKLKKKYKKFILINTNMGYGNNIRGDEFVKDGYGKWFDNINDIIDYDKVKMRSYISLVKKITEFYNGLIIFRPHPEEDIQYYRLAFRNYPKVKVINNGSVIPWLISCDLMIHPDCTTSIESLFLGKKPISYLPFRKENNIITDLPLRISRRIKNIDELISIINNNDLLTIEISNDDKELLENNFSVSSNSTDLIVAQLIRIFNKQIESNSKEVSFKDRILLTYQGLKTQINNDISAKSINKKLSGFTSKTIKSIHVQCGDINNNLSKIRVHRIANTLFRFSLTK